MKVVRGDRSEEKKIKASRGWMILKERSHLYKVQDEAESVNVETKTSYLEDPAKIIKQSGLLH